MNVLDWRSSTNRRVIEASFAAETHAALVGLGMGHCSQVLMAELRFGSDVVGSVEDDGWSDPIPMTLVTDCKSVYDTVHKDGQHISDRDTNPTVRHTIANLKYPMPEFATTQASDA